MRIIYNGQDFELSKKFAATYRRFNMLISTKGDQTQTFTLPGSPHNLELIGWSNRVDSLYKPLQDIDVLVIDGLMCKPCNMSFNTIPSKQNGINCTLYSDTGEFYSKVGDTILNSLPWPVIKSPNYYTNTLVQNVDYLITYLKAGYTNPGPDKNFKIAPVSTNYDIVRRVSGVDYTEKLILNAYDKYNNTLDILAGNVYLNVFEAEYTHTFIENDATINIDKGYGMTPLLKLRYVLNFLFAHYGYTLDMSEFETLVTNSEEESNYENIVIGNNVADAIYAGALLYKQLVPNLKIKDFLAKMETNLTGKFVVVENRKQVKFLLLKNAFTTDSDAVLDEYMSEPPLFSDTAFKILRLVDNNSTSDSINEAEKETEDIKIDIVSTDSMYLQYKSNLTPPAVDVALAMGVVGQPVHLNSTIKIVGKESTSTDAEISEKLQLFYALDTWQEQSVFVPNQGYRKIYYKNTNRLFYFDLMDYGETTMEVLQWLYSEYFEFRLNSNIPFTVKMNIPETVVNQLKFYTPKILLGQRVMIESIEIPMGKTPLNQGEQVVNFRTLRSYADRP